MVEEVCPSCRGFGKVHPVSNGAIDYSCLAFCSCQGEKASKTAHPPVKHPDIDRDTNYRRLPDEFDAVRQMRYRRSEAFKTELKEALKDDPGFRCIEQPDKGQPRSDGWRELVAMKAEMDALKDDMNGLIKKEPVAVTPEIPDFTGITGITDFTGVTGITGIQENYRNSR